MTPLEFYSALLESAGLTPKEGAQGLFPPGSTVPVTVKGKILVLPTKDILDRYNDILDTLQVFHPICENVTRRDSEVFNFLKSAYRQAITVDLITVVSDLAAVANDSSLQKGLTQKQRNYLADLGNIDDKTIKVLNDIFNRTDPHGDNKLIDFSIQRGGSIDGTKYNRVGITHLNVLSQLRNNQDHVFGVKLRKKDVQLLDALFSQVFKHLVEGQDEIPILVEYGSNELVAPSFYTLTLCYLEMRKAIAKVHHVFHKKFRDIIGTEFAWEDGLNRLDVYRTLIPVLAGNTGDETIGEKQDRQHLPSQDRRKQEEPKDTLKQAKALGQARTRIDTEAISAIPSPEAMSYAARRKQAIQHLQEVEERQYRDRYRGRRDGSNYERRRSQIDISDVVPEENDRNQDHIYTSRSRSYERREDRNTPTIRDRYGNRSYNRDNGDNYPVRGYMRR